MGWISRSERRNGAAGRTDFAVGTAVMVLVCSPGGVFEFAWHYFAPPLVECLSSPGDGFGAVR